MLTLVLLFLLFSSSQCDDDFFDFDDDGQESLVNSLPSEPPAPEPLQTFNSPQNTIQTTLPPSPLPNNSNNSSRLEQMLALNRSSEGNPNKNISTSEKIGEYFQS